MAMGISEKTREDTILEAALISFSRYGFTRTKMDDIASASGIGRTALYKQFRNKEHIFLGLCERVHSEALDLASAALAAPQPFVDRLESALLQRDLHLLQIGHSGPHADEIAGLYLTLAGELSDSFNERLVKMLAQAADEAVSAGEFRLPAAYSSAQDFARLLRLALEGIKKEVKSVDAFEPLARQMIRALSG